MKIKRLFLIVIAFLSITLVANAQYKINIECQNHTHDDYIFTGHISDGTNTQFWNISVPAATTKNVIFIVNSPNWYRQDARITHTSGNIPIADFWMNDPGPYAVYRNAFGNNKCYQDPAYYYTYSKLYYYRIEAN